MVKVFSLPKCGKCDSAKQKLEMFDIDYEEKPYAQFTTWHEGWDEDGSVGVLAARNFFGEKAVPLIEYCGVFYDYPGFMRFIKKNGKTV